MYEYAYTVTDTCLYTFHNVANLIAKLFIHCYFNLPLKIVTTALARWLSWLERCPHTRGLQVQSIVRAHTQVAGLVLGGGA